MKIKIKDISYNDFINLKPYENKKPYKQSKILKKLVELIAKKDLKSTNYKAEFIDMEKLGNEPALILMNHSSFIDLEIVFHLFKDRKFNLVSTEDSFIGKETLLRHLGCIPTIKYTADQTLVRNMMYAVKELNQSLIMFPEASYSLDGRSRILPKSISKCIKLLKIPVVVINTKGAFLRDPLYNNLQIRKVDVSSKVKYVLSKEDIESLDSASIQEIIESYFNFDNFKDQMDSKIDINEPFRADLLNRVLYKCPQCLKENQMVGKGTNITCTNCNSKWELSIYGELLSESCKINTVSKWYDFERDSLIDELKNDCYLVDEEVDIYGIKNFKALYHLGNGRLIHNKEGFKLYLNNELIYTQKPNLQYTLNSDFYWYELGDVIAIGDKNQRYYSVIKSNHDVVTKAKIAQEEMYKM